jgi:predicted MFS family arabinose efflux permease
MASQFIAAGQAAALVLLILTGLIRVEYIAALAAINGMAETFAQPARQCLIPGLVPRAYLPGAVALNSLTYNVARFIGPALSGPMIAAWGVVPPIACNCAAFLFASVTMHLLRLDPAIRIGHRSSHGILHDAVEGVRYVARHRGIGPLLLFAAAVGVSLRSVPEMLPPYVADLFGRDARGLAMLASTMGLAALVGGSLVAIRGQLGGLTQIAVAAGFVLVLATASFVATHHFAVGVVCIGVMGAATTMHGISIQTLLQNSSSAAMVGRVLSLWGMITRAAPAMGALAYGAASEFVGLQVPVLLGCALCGMAWLRARSGLPRMAPILEGSETLA